METLTRTSVYDVSRPIPPVLMDLKKYNTLYVNVNTLVRNAIQAVPSADLPRLGIDDIVDFCNGEMQIITALLQDMSHLAVQFYTSGFGNMYIMPVVERLLREPSTDKQKYIDKVSKRAIHGLVAASKDVLKPRYLLPTRHINAIILTHIVTDLYVYKKYASLALLESNTGIMKPPSRFATKYLNVPDHLVGFVPFSFHSGAIIGDSVVFKPAPVKAKREYLAACGHFKWNAATSDTKVLTDLSTSQFELAHYYFKLIPTNI